MLELTIPEIDLYDDKTQTFIHYDSVDVQLEHSLLSISKWESKWHKVFLSKDAKTEEETIDYIRCMLLTPNIDPEMLKYLPLEAAKKINEYIEDPMTATWFSDKGKQGGSREIITSELIYYWMISLQIPFECENWHLNRLLTLIHVCDVKNSPKKKMSKADLMRRNTALNNARRAKYNTKG